MRQETLNIYLLCAGFVHFMFLKLFFFLSNFISLFSSVAYIIVVISSQIHCSDVKSVTLHNTGDIYLLGP